MATVKKELLDTKIEAFDVSLRLSRVLKNTKIDTVRQFLKFKPSDFSIIKGSTDRIIKEIVEIRKVIMEGL